MFLPRIIIKYLGTQAMKNVNNSAQVGVKQLIWPLATAGALNPY